MINQHALPNANVFQFSHTNPTEVIRQIDLLDTNKSNSGCIPTRILTAMKDVVCLYLTDCLNSTIYDCNFPSELMKAELCPLFKNGYSNHRGN